ncbi:putative non-F420 flavinoid oxidoreductase [Lewinella marina]|uniref:LLM class F420-dependent oxidoreductase n=1 Tax=Neolewinella marina TaxID=438751 RepID=A0A2G0CF79_9BACT|nr:TIGR03885 family FMN-dependent LLM class oxidoreductase [Neolewinella marina]NJB85746.1 putative non-F420 flavinoid oxidoreductase [Neolewinella marina]PHK98580.1 LLM class F420-dependent oxidoreductase [Neolewinella marina]
MAAFGYQISQEQFTPRRLLELAKQAEAAGFDELASSDHLFPWSHAQGQSGFTWSWLGSALEATSLPCGVVNCPNERYHPVIIAQAVATLCQMYPGRFWPSFGSGEFLNEHITGNHWPDKAARNRKLAESVSVMRRLWAGEQFTHRGEFITAEDVQLFTLPEEPPVAIGCAITATTAADIAAWADGLYTVWQPHNKLDDVIDAFRSNGGEGKPIYLKVDLCCAPTREEAIELAHAQWRTNVGTSAVHGELRTPEQFEAASQFIGPREVAESIRISVDPDEHVELLKKDLALGVDKIVLHNVGLNQDYFLKFYGEQVLPKLR